MPDERGDKVGRCTRSGARLILRLAVMGMSHWGVAAVVVVAALSSQVVGGQTVARGSGAISGVVTDGATGRPLERVVVYLGIQGVGPVGAVPRVATDSRGRFLFRDVPASDRLFVSVSRPGYFDGVYGGRRPGDFSVHIALRDGEWFPKADVKMWRPAAISGTVVDEAGEPAVGVIVRSLSRALIAGRRQLIAGPMAKTDDQGGFRIRGLPPGSYLVSVPSVQFAVPPGTPASTLAGLSVDAVAQLGQAGREVQSRNDPALDLDPLSRLIIGHYLTPPPPVNGRSQAYPPIFHPGTTVPAEALEIELGYGEDRRGVNLALRPTPAVRVSGRLQGPAGAISELTVRLTATGAEGLGEGSETATALVASTGVFTFLNVPAGSYTLEASRQILSLRMPGSGWLPSTPGMIGASSGLSGSVTTGPFGTTFSLTGAKTAEKYWARTSIQVGHDDLRNLVVEMRPALKMTGRIVFEGHSQAPASLSRGGVAMFLEPANGDAALGLQYVLWQPGNSRNTFEVDGLLPGEYCLRLDTLAGWIVKSVVHEGRDYADQPIDTRGGRDLTEVVVTLTDRLTELSGRVSDVSGASAIGGDVLAFPVEPERWSSVGFTPSRIKRSRVSADGYRFQRLPAGEYFLAAVGPSHVDDWHDPDFLAQAARVARRVRLDWGQKIAVDLQVKEIK